MAGSIARRGIGLKEVREFYLKAQYKQCIIRCREAIDPSQTSETSTGALRFLNFYCALSYDSIASSMHALSSSVLTTFNLSLDYYTAATSICRELEEELTAFKNSNGKSGASAFYAENLRPSDNNSMGRSKEPSSASSNKEIDSNVTDEDHASCSIYKPENPHLVVDVDIDNVREACSRVGRKPPYPLMLPEIVARSDTVSCSSTSPRSASFNSSSSTLVPPEAAPSTNRTSLEVEPTDTSRQAGKYMTEPPNLAIQHSVESLALLNTDQETNEIQTRINTALTRLEEFQQLIRNQILRIEAQKEATLAIIKDKVCDGVKVDPKLFGNARREAGLEDAERAKRIQDGKARNWTRERFNPQRYKDLVTLAAREL